MDVELESQRFYLPGQSVSEQKIQYNSSNLYQNRQNRIVALKYGQLSKKQKKVDNNEKIQYLDLMNFSYIYQPQKGDLVIGTIKMKSADYYIVDIGAPLDAILGALQFDGATKRNKPNIVQGSLVYCRVIQHSKHLGSKLSCFNKGFNTKNDLGQLKGGIKVQAPRFKHNLVQKYLDIIAKYLKFQIAFGKNGFIWIKTQSLASTIVLFNVINQILQGCSQQLMIRILQTAK